MTNDRVQKGLCAAIVTFRRPQAVQHAVACLLEGERVPEQIVIVDNDPAALGDVADYLESLAEVSYFPLESNQGSAGGFRKAAEEGFRLAEWVLFLDDDTAVQKTTISRLMAHVEDLKGAPAVLRTNNTGYPLGLLRPVTDFAWRGTMVHRACHEKVGLPLSDFFLYGSDVEYGCRIHDAGFPMHMATDSFLDIGGDDSKEQVTFLGREISFNATAFRLYYSFRNSLRLQFINPRISRLCRLAVYSAAVLFSVTFLSHSKERGRTGAILRGLWHGMIGRKGKIIEP